MGACPAYVWGHELKGDFKSLDPNHTFLVKYDAQGQLTTMPLEINLLTKAGLMDHFNQKPQKRRTLARDRFVFNVHDLGQRYRSSFPKLCKAPMLEIKASSSPSRYGYLIQCASRKKKAFASPIKVPPGKPVVQSPNFSYQHKPENLLVYDEILIRDPKKPWIKVSRDADLLLHLDVISFFTIELDRHNLTAQLHKAYNGPLGRIHNLNFYIHILFFTIDLEFGTLFSFYKDSAHAPTVFDVPENAWERLHPSSGLLLNWMPADAVIDRSDPLFNMPEAKPSVIMKGFREDAKRGLQHCRGNTCRFILTFKSGGLRFRVQTTVPKKYVARGFYPQLVRDLTKFRTALEWSVDATTDQGRIGLFMNNTGLPEGTHPVDHWFYMVDDNQLQMTCPQRVKLGAVM